MHGVLHIGCVVFQPKDKELLFLENREPVQKIHSVQPNLQPHLGPERKASFQEYLPHATRHFSVWCVTIDQAQRDKPTPKMVDFKRHAIVLLARIPT